MIQIAVIFTLVVAITAKPGYINSVPTYHNAIALQAAPIALAQPIVQPVPQDVSYTRTDIISRKVTGGAPTAAYVDGHGIAGYVENSVPQSVKHVHYIEENISRNGQSTQQNEAEPVIEDKLRHIQIPQPQRIVVEGTSTSEAQSQQISSNSMNLNRQALTQSQQQQQQHQHQQQQQQAYEPQAQYLPSVSRISQEQQQQQQQQAYEPQAQYLPSVSRISQEQQQQVYIEQQQQQQWQQQQLQQQQIQLQQQQQQIQQQAQQLQHQQSQLQQQSQLSSELKSAAQVASTETNQKSQQLNFEQPQFNILQENLRSVPYLPQHQLQYKSPALQIYNNPQPIEHPAPRLQQEDTESITTVAAEAPVATQSVDNQHQPQQQIAVSHSVVPAAKLSYSVISAPQIAYAQHSAIPATYSSSALVSNVYPAAIAGVEKTYYPATAARIETLAAPTVYHTPTVYNAPLKLAEVHQAPALTYNVATKVVENPAAVQYSNVY